MTHFVHAALQLPEGALVLDGNSKITRSNGTFAEPAPNALSLPAASVSGARNCPGSTPVCRASCYVRGLALVVPDVYAAYTTNAATLTRVLSAGYAARMHAANMLANWINAHAPGGFRWHVSGDVWHQRHAEWIIWVASLSGSVPMWIYTRTLSTVATLRRAQNLAVNVSADRDNLREARQVARMYGARLCYMADDGGHVPQLAPGDVIFPDYALRGRDLTEPTSAPWWEGLTHAQRAMVCMADFAGQSEQFRCGPCRKCLT